MLCETDCKRRSFGRKPRNVCEKSFKKVENRPLLSNSVEAFLVPPHNLAERYPASSSGGVSRDQGGSEHGRNGTVRSKYPIEAARYAAVRGRTALPSATPTYKVEKVITVSLSGNVRGGFLRFAHVSAVRFGRNDVKTQCFFKTDFLRLPLGDLSRSD